MQNHINPTQNNQQNSQSYQLGYPDQKMTGYDTGQSCEIGPLSSANAGRLQSSVGPVQNSQNQNEPKNLTAKGEHHVPSYNQYYPKGSAMPGRQETRYNGLSLFSGSEDPAACSIDQPIQARQVRDQGRPQNMQGNPPLAQGQSRQSDCKKGHGSDAQRMAESTQPPVNERTETHRNQTEKVTKTRNHVRGNDKRPQGVSSSHQKKREAKMSKKVEQSQAASSESNQHQDCHTRASAPSQKKVAEQHTEEPQVSSTSFARDKSMRPPSPKNQSHHQGNHSSSQRDRHHQGYKSSSRKRSSKKHKYGGRYEDDHHRHTGDEGNRRDRDHSSCYRQQNHQDQRGYQAHRSSSRSRRDDKYDRPTDYHANASRRSRDSHLHPSRSSQKGRALSQANHDNSESQRIDQFKPAQFPIETYSPTKMDDNSAFKKYTQDGRFADYPALPAACFTQARDAGHLPSYRSAVNPSNAEPTNIIPLRQPMSPPQPQGPAVVNQNTFGHGDHLPREVIMNTQQESNCPLDSTSPFPSLAQPSHALPQAPLANASRPQIPQQAIQIQRVVDLGLPELSSSQNQKIEEINELNENNNILQNKTQNPERRNINPGEPQRLPTVRIFETIDQLQGGTFKFAKNKNYSANLSEWTGSMGDAFKKSVRGKELTSQAVSKDILERAQAEYIAQKEKELRPGLKYQKTFVGIFPFLYETLDAGEVVGVRKSLQLWGTAEYKTEDGSTEPIHQGASIKFCIKDNKLLKYEETRQKQIDQQNEFYRQKQQGMIKGQRVEKGDPFVDYRIDVDFNNIKSVWVQRAPAKGPVEPRQQSSLQQSQDQQRRGQYGNQAVNQNQEVQHPSQLTPLEEREMFQRKMTYLTLLVQFKRPCQVAKFGPGENYKGHIKRRKNSDDRKSVESNTCQERLFEPLAAGGQGLTLKNRSKSIVADRKFADKLAPSGPLAQQLDVSGKDDNDTEMASAKSDDSQGDEGRWTASNVRSPFNMTSNIEQEAKPEEYRDRPRGKDDAAQINYETLLNYWNNNQVIKMAGLAPRAQVDAFIKTLRKANPKAKVYENKAAISEYGIYFPETKEELKREITSIKRHGLQFSDQLNKMRPSLRFSILALLSQNKFNIFNIGLTKFMESLNRGGWNRDDAAADFGAYLIDHINLEVDLEYKDDSSKIDDIFQRLVADRKGRVWEDWRKKIENGRDNNLMRQRRVLVTPTLNHYPVAREEESNKVLRQYADQASKFIRLTFVNEDLEKNYYGRVREAYLLGYVHSILKRGFYAGRNFPVRFLNYSNSQLKNHTVWFLCHQKNGLSEKAIMDSMGTFDQEKNILKRYARRGQCFSTTKFVKQLEKAEVLQCIPDIERNGFAFSDGCGYIHEDLAQLVAKQFQFTQVSAMQIRIGGAKGVLSVPSNADVFNKEDCTQHQVLLRESQVKFPSDNLSLDIIRCATFSQGFLNQQIIILLHALGVPTEFFLQKQQVAKQYACLESIQKRIQEKIDKINIKFGNILKHESGTFSLDYALEKNTRLKKLAKDMKLSMEGCKSFQAHFKQALLKGMDLMKDPVFSSILYCMQVNQFMTLKKKARILLPDSCVLIGIIDPTGTLEADEIFVQTRKDNFSIHNHGYGLSNRKNRMEEAEIINSIDSLAEIIEGDVLVTRSPCSHPGDIRRLKCVDRPQLRYLFNVVVFSSKGERPECNKMSGGDLDGDTYFVTWDKELLSHVRPEAISAPADYSKCQLLKEKPDGEELADYFVFYLQRDVLGQVSKLWLTLSDQYGQRGPFEEDCISLSHMCSVAVDFAKHGECVAPKNFEHLQKKVKYHPDFLEKDPSKTRLSDGVLGHLYRDIKPDEARKQFFYNDWESSIQLNYELDQKILGLVKNGEGIMHSYLIACYEKIVLPMTAQIKKAMYFCQLANEGELLASTLQYRLCFNTSNDPLVYSGDPGSRTEDAIQNLNTSKREIKTKFTQVLAEIIQAGAEKGDTESEINVAVALYLATYFDSDNRSCREYYQQHHQQDANLVSFQRIWSEQDSWRCETCNQRKMHSHHLQSGYITDEERCYCEKMRKHSQHYLQECLEAEQGNKKKMGKLLALKKIFCLPWLIVPDILLVNYPDRFDTPEYKESLQKQFQAQESNDKNSHVQNPEHQAQRTSNAERGQGRHQLSMLTQEEKLAKIFGPLPARRQFDGAKNNPQVLTEIQIIEERQKKAKVGTEADQTEMFPNQTSDVNLVQKDLNRPVQGETAEPFIDILLKAHRGFQQMKLTEQAEQRRSLRPPQKDPCMGHQQN